MSKINQIGYGQLSALNKTQMNSPSARPTESSRSNEVSGDRVEISERARLLGQIASMPDIREEKVQEIRQQLADGSYDLEGKLSEALDRLLQEHNWE